VRPVEGERTVVNKRMRADYVKYRKEKELYFRAKAVFLNI
jgi:hypothetical protein